MVGIEGSLDNLQLSVDFYLSATSKNAVSDSKTMRDRFFAIFKEEDSYRSDNYLVYQERITNDYKVNYDVEPELVGGELVFDAEINYFSNSGSSKTVKESKVLEVEESISKQNTTPLVVNNAKSEVEDDDFVEQSYSNVSTDEEFTDFDEEEDEFSGWGNDDDEEEYETEEVSETTYEEDDDFISWGNDEVDEVEEVIEDEVIEEEVEEEEVNPAEEWGIEEFDDSFDFEDEVVPEVKTVVKELPKPEKVVEAVVTDVPKDLREFVKMYPNCEMSFALKYFSKKEIETQLNKGRVFKRKNRLLI